MQGSRFRKPLKETQISEPPTSIEPQNDGTGPEDLRLDQYCLTGNEDAQIDVHENNVRGEELEALVAALDGQPWKQR